MKIVYFAHSILSCWNHGNAHFVRGILRELLRRGHAVRALEPTGGWSLTNLLADHGPEALSAYRAAYPDLPSESYDTPEQALAACGDADLVIVHEWNAPALVAAVGAARKRGARFTLLFHDTHHRAVSDPDAIRAFDLDGYDGVLAFGETLAEVYRRWGWGRHVFVWHEAADTTLFRPPADPSETERRGLVWVGNWGDGERTHEIETYLLAPAALAGLPLDIYGVRYPAEALTLLQQHGVHYRGWLANAVVPKVLANHMATIHVPRRFYARHLPGIPTIRVFEALACGIPLLSAPWNDVEGLFRVGRDFLMAENGSVAGRQLRALRHDADLRAALATAGLETIRGRHTCVHRVDQLLAIVQGLGHQINEIAGAA